MRPVRAAPTGQVGAETTPGDPGVRTPRPSSFAAPGMVLLAALAVFEGYHWLQIIPDGTIRPWRLLFTVGVLPAAWRLTRRLSTGPAATLRRLVLGTAAAVPAIGMVVLLTRGTGWARVLGVASLILAASALVLVLVSERSAHSAPPS